MGVSAIFTVPECWLGGHYTLVMVLPQREVEQIRAAFSALWHCPDLEGVYSEFNLEPQDQQRHQPKKYPNLLEDHAYGVLVRTDGVRLACGSWVFLMDGQTDAWLEFYIPMGTLSENDPRVGAFPFSSDGGSEVWRRPLDEQLVHIAERVYAAARFQWAIVGSIVATVDEVGQLYRTSEPPSKRGVGYLVEQGSGLVWYPPTQYDPVFTIG